MYTIDVILLAIVNIKLQKDFLVYAYPNCETTSVLSGLWCLFVF